MGLVGQNQQTPFTNPQAGQSPIGSSVVRGNDNTLVAKLNAHDADATIHVQTGLLANRPAATTPYAMYMDADGRLYQSDGADWAEVPYARLDAVGTNAFTGTVTVGTNFAVTGTSALGVTTTGALQATGATDVVGTLDVSGACDFASTVAIGGAVTITGAVGVTGTVTATTFAGSGASLTNLPAANLTGTLPALNGAALTALNASNLASGTVAAARLPTSYAALTVTALTATGIVGTGGDATSLFLTGADSYLITGSSSASWLSAVNPGGSASQWIVVRLGVTDYKIPLFAA